LIASRARFAAIRKLERSTGLRIPDQVFHGAFLEAVSAGVNLRSLDGATREQIRNLLHDFVSCGCRDAPECGCPERLFAARVIELRESGLDHRQIAEHLLDEYGISVYPADLLSFLEDSVHGLEALRDVARLGGGGDPLAAKCEEHIRRIVR
jgi:superfamily II helicase